MRWAACLKTLILSRHSGTTCIPSTTLDHWTTADKPFGMGSPPLQESNAVNEVHQPSPQLPAAGRIVTPRGVIRHFAAIGCTTVFLAVLPFVIYCVWVFGFAPSGDVGGALNFFIVPLVGGIGGVASSLIVFLPLSLPAQRTGLRRWVKWTGIFTAGLVLIIAGMWLYDFAYKKDLRTIPIVLVASMLLYWVGGFFVYLCFIAVGRKVLP